RPALVEETVVGLVEDQATVPSLAPLDDALELFPFDDSARRVVRRVQDDAARPLRRALREVRGDRLPMGLELRRHVERRGARKPDHLGKRDPVWTEERDLVLRLEEDLAGVEDGLLCAGRDEDVLARQGDAVLAPVFLGDRVAKGGLAGDVRVTRPPRLDRRDSRRAHEVRRRKVGLPQTEVDDVHAGRGESLRLAGHGRRRGRREGGGAARQPRSPHGLVRSPVFRCAQARRKQAKAGIRFFPSATRKSSTTIQAPYSQSISPRSEGTANWTSHSTKRPVASYA